MQLFEHIRTFQVNVINLTQLEVVVHEVYGLQTMKKKKQLNPKLKLPMT